MTTRERKAVLKDLTPVLVVRSSAVRCKFMYVEKAARAESNDDDVSTKEEKVRVVDGEAREQEDEEVVERELLEADKCHKTTESPFSFSFLFF